MCTEHVALNPRGDDEDPRLRAPRQISEIRDERELPAQFPRVRALQPSDDHHRTRVALLHALRVRCRFRARERARVALLEALVREPACLHLHLHERLGE